MSEPDQIDMMSETELRDSLRLALRTVDRFATTITSLQHSLAAAERELAEVRAETREAFADEVISLITTEQRAMGRLYSKHTYGINKVCNRLKLFVGDLLKPRNPERGEQ